MPCCGNQRAKLQGPIRVSPVPSRQAPASEQRRVLRDRVFFKYLGRTGMTVIGPATGKRYRFNGPGSIIEVDLRDRRSVALLPQLLEMK